MAGWDTDIDPDDDPVLFWAAWFNQHAEDEEHCETCCYFGLDCTEITTPQTQSPPWPPPSALR